MHDIAQALPSYWLVQASHVGVGGHGWGATGWIVVARVDRRGRVSRAPRVRARHEAHVDSIRLAMADERELSLQEQLEEIGAQLDWVRGYL